MTGWLRRSKKVTADTARRITGLSGPFGGVQWADPGPGEGELVRRFLVFLEDRRVLYNPTYLEVESQVEHSIHEIREECTKTLQTLPDSAFAANPIRAIREAGRRFHDEQNEEFSLLEGGRHFAHARAGFLVALGMFRARVAHEVALLAGRYDIDIEGDLASLIVVPCEEP